MVELKDRFPDSFFEEEERLGFSISRKRKEIWAVELDMLYELDRVCKKLQIRYFLDGGTLLGAARDGRFIPWDDDIDVAMLREDYDRFVREAPNEFGAPLFLQTGYTEPGYCDPNYFRGHCQLRNSNTCAILPDEKRPVSFNQGIFLDIFVLDELFPEKVEAQYEKRKKLLRMRKVWNHHDRHRNPIRYTVRWARYLLYHARYPDFTRAYAQVEKIFRSRQKSEYVDYLMLNWKPEQVHYLRREWYEDAVLLPFEGRAFPAPKGYREYLACYYGEDWMTPKNIPSMHNAAGQVFFDTGRSYREVLEELARHREQ